VPPLISIDQEGGRVQRLKDGFTRIPPMRELAAQGANAVSLAAMNVAAELRSVGIHCNLAPVCDVPTHAEDTIIGKSRLQQRPDRSLTFCSGGTFAPRSPACSVWPSTFLVMALSALTRTLRYRLIRVLVRSWKKCIWHRFALLSVPVSAAS
jgi:hypothetical protein